MKTARKFNIIFLVLLVAIVSVACKKESTNSTQNINNIQTDNNSSKVLTNEEQSEDISFNDMLPNYKNYFKSDDVTVIDSDGGDSYCISIKNITKEQYNSYKTACENGNFSIVTFNGDTMFKARNKNEKYYVSLQYWVESETDNSQNSINITCGLVK